MGPLSSWQHESWATTAPVAGDVLLHCLLPSGVYVPLPATASHTLRDVKEDLWELAAYRPLAGMLLDPSLYTFQYVDLVTGLEDAEDESRRLRDLKPFCGILRIIRRRIKDAEEKLNSQISRLIGKGIHEFDTLKITEVNEFRVKMRQLAEETAAQRREASWMELLLYKFPPRLANSPTLPETLANRRRVGTDSFVLVSKFEKVDASFTFNVSYTSKPMQLLKIILMKKANAMQIQGDPADFILKVCGKEEYLFGNYPLVQFLYIQETLARDGVPQVVTLPITSLPIDRDLYSTPLVNNKLNLGSFSTLTLRKKGKTTSSWSIDDDYTCTITGIRHLNIDATKNLEVGVQVGLFHGGKALCQTKKTMERPVLPDGSITWDEKIIFPLKVYNVPRMARLCFVLYEVTKNAKGLKSRRLKGSHRDVFMNPLVWVNTSVFDYKNKLKTDATTLYMWNYSEDTLNDDVLNALGTTVSNPNCESPALLINCSDYNQANPIFFPSDDEIRKFAQENKDSGIAAFDRMGLDPVSTERINQLRLTADKDPLYEMHEQDKKELWALRNYIRENQPALLPKLLHCVEWNMKEEAAGAAGLVDKWPTLSPARALELLDYAYADRLVRRFAVSCLVNISDEDLSLYLLQLVQALKHETYYMCDLMEFLLKRALANRKIGHYLFWHLKSEMKVPSVSIRFGLILEAYCRGSEDHVNILLKQTECLEKLIATSELVRMRRDSHKARNTLYELLIEESYQEALSNVTSALDPSYSFKSIKVDKCKVMDSKMRPLWLVFDNQDHFGSDISVILKNGDDLRQDMLTLQMIKIMDKVWKDAGYDFRMNSYGCISMDHRVGMIEVVLDAETIANIQKEKGLFSATSPFKKGSLLSWLRDHNNTEESLNKAIEEFTLSCAGYCVATYVLGVADRHSDNIMVKKSGQLFHIDFGHILGHFKEKFGFRRERVPFVLTHDFVNVINKGQKDAKKEAIEFINFQNHCEQAFMILRRHGYLFLSLFAMMISTGLPELSSEKDLTYLRDTLVLDMADQEALTHFRGKFEEALSNSWKTSLNWASHNMAKNNKQ